MKSGVPFNDERPIRLSDQVIYKMDWLRENLSYSGRCRKNLSNGTQVVHKDYGAPKYIVHWSNGRTLIMLKVAVHDHESKVVKEGTGREIGNTFDWI